MVAQLSDPLKPLKHHSNIVPNGGRILGSHWGLAGEIWRKFESGPLGVVGWPGKPSHNPPSSYLSATCRCNRHSKSLCWPILIWNTSATFIHFLEWFRLNPLIFFFLIFDETSQKIQMLWCEGLHVTAICAKPHRNSDIEQLFEVIWRNSYENLPWINVVENLSWC